jgi:hypothetical protein
LFVRHVDEALEEQHWGEEQEDILFVFAFFLVSFFLVAPAPVLSTEVAAAAAALPVAGDCSSSTLLLRLERLGLCVRRDERVALAVLVRRDEVRLERAERDAPEAREEAPGVLAGVTGAELEDVELGLAAEDLTRKPEDGWLKLCAARAEADGELELRMPFFASSRFLVRAALYSASSVKSS